MSHVDEGALHAYLDGALDEYPAAEARRVREHLEACDECAERLAAERRVREEAQDILALASPRVDIPTLEELRAYVKAQSPPRSTARIRLYRLSWAASVVLALGTGWLLRGGVPQSTLSEGRGLASDQGAGSAPSELGAEPFRTSESGQSNEAATGLAGEATDGAGPAAPDAVAGAQRVAPSATTGTAAPPESRAPSGQDAQRATTASEPRPELAERRAPAAPMGAGGAAPAVGLADAADADAAASKAADDTAADAVAGGGRAPEPDPSPAAVAPSAPAQTLSATADRARQDTAPDEAVAQRAAEQRLRSAIAQPPTVVGLGAGASTLGRAADAPADFSADSAETVPVSLVVPGLEVLDVLRIGQETVFLGTRALQLLPTGDTLEMAHLPPGVDATVLPPLRLGWSELIQPRGSGWLVMRAPVPPSVLAELLQRLEASR